jgi:hypothetical protein
MTTLQDEVTFHEMVIQLGQDASVRSALGALHQNPALGAELARNPSDFVARRGIRLPPGVQITVPDANPSALRIEAHFDVGPRKARISWTPDRGFVLEAAS